MKRYKQFKKEKLKPFARNVLHLLAAIALCLLFVIVPLSTTHAQTPTTPAPAPTSTSKGASVVLGGEELFNIRTGLGAFSPQL